MPNLNDNNSEQLMYLKVLLPSKVFAEYESITSMVVETPEGAFGLLAHRRDCVAALEPGILSYIVEGQTQQYLAHDTGVMLKNGRHVLVSVRNAISGNDLATLKKAVQTEFMTLNEKESEVRAVLARLESGFMRGFKSLT